MLQEKVFRKTMVKKNPANFKGNFHKLNGSRVTLFMEYLGYTFKNKCYFSRQIIQLSIRFFSSIALGPVYLYRPSSSLIEQPPPNLEKSIHRGQDAFF